MAQHNYFGKKGEELAAGWLLEKGYEILHRNWRHGRYEIDIIARMNDAYHFIEVKTATGDACGHPEEWVGKEKIRRLMRAAAAWLYQWPGTKRVQYDVLAINIRDTADPEYFFIEDVYL